MKDLHYHKKQLRQHRARNAFNEALGRALDAISERVLANSNERWDNLQHDLQRCNPTPMTFIIED